MDEACRKEILEILAKAIAIMEAKEEREIEELKELSEEAEEGVALHKDLDLISITVLIYSLYKVAKGIPPKDYQAITEGLKRAKDCLEQKNLGKYNRNIKFLYEIVRKSDAKIKEHLADVMHAARIKKGASLLHKGLSIGQAAGLMGLSNWDLQQYVGRTVAFELHREMMPARKRLIRALELFGVK